MAQHFPQMKPAAAAAVAAVVTTVAAGLRSCLTVPSDWDTQKSVEGTQKMEWSVMSMQMAVTTAAQILTAVTYEMDILLTSVGSQTTMTSVEGTQKTVTSVRGTLNTTAVRLAVSAVADILTTVASEMDTLMTARTVVHMTSSGLLRIAVEGILRPEA